MFRSENYIVMYLKTLPKNIAWTTVLTKTDTFHTFQTLPLYPYRKWKKLNTLVVASETRKYNFMVINFLAYPPEYI